MSGRYCSAIGVTCKRHTLACFLRYEEAEEKGEEGKLLEQT